MKRLIAAAIRCSLIFLVPSVTYAISPQWDLDPMSGDWNTAANWTPNRVPNGPSDIATFGLSNTTDVSISANTEVNSIVFTPAATTPYTITASPGLRLTISGVGIVNNSGTTQNFLTDANFFPTGLSRQIFFTGSATAGSLTKFVNRGTQGVTTPGGGTVFYDTSSASTGVFVNEASSAPFAGGGQTLFYNQSTAAHGTFTNNGGIVRDGFGAETIFSDGSTAANGTFTNNGGTVAPAPFHFPGSFGGITLFKDASTAANGLFINNSATAVNAVGGQTLFWNSSTAANGTFINNGGAVTVLFGDSAAGNTGFSDNSTAANGTFINNGGAVSGARGGSTAFGNTSTASNGTFTNNGGTVSGAQGGFTEVSGTAANGTFINNGAAVSGAGGGFTTILSTAGNGTFVNNGDTVAGALGGSTQFEGTSTAASATLVANGGSNGGGGGTILFADQSRLGTARIEVFGNGSLDISRHNAPGMTIDSIEGDGNVFLGANNLTVGSDNLNTTFACAIQDGGQGGGVGGSLTKVGTGTLELTGANTFTGDTNVNRGVLQVDRSISSNTFVHTRGTLAGTGTINGRVTNNGRVSPGSAASPGMLTVTDNYTQAQYATLMIQIAGTNTGQFSVMDVMGNANLNGFLDPMLLNGFVPTIGDSFTFLNYASFTGGFSHILNQVFNHGTEQWDVVYQPNKAILTVGPNTIPDQGSTFLLLTLGLLGLVTYRRQLLRGQS